MNVQQAIMKRRTIRRFTQKPIDYEILKELINCARFAPSAANLQPLEYIVVLNKELCNQVFSTLRWAAYIKPEWKPAEHEQPTAYIIILVKKQTALDPKRDIGLSAAYIILAAEEYDIGSCIILNVDRDTLQVLLKVPEEFMIDCVIALGYKKEVSIVEKMKDSVEYWRDEKNILHVPKRSLEDILHRDIF